MRQESSHHVSYVGRHDVPAHAATESSVEVSGVISCGLAGAGGMKMSRKQGKGPGGPRQDEQPIGDACGG